MLRLLSSYRNLSKDAGKLFGSRLFRARYPPRKVLVQVNCELYSVEGRSNANHWMNRGNLALLDPKVCWTHSAKPSPL